MDERVPITIASIGAIIALFCAVLYFMNLSIFNKQTIEWFFTYGLGSAAISIAALALKTIWQKTSIEGNY